MTGMQERDISKHQQGLVDTCFEEGQYEEGIALLNQMRGVRPSSLHMRELIYIALYPHPPTHNDLALSTSPVKLESPRKMRLKRSQLDPSPEATDAALELLGAYSRSNSAQSLLRGLPNYDTPFEEADLLEQEDESSIAKQSRRILEARSCWDMLKQGFVRRRSEEPHAEASGRKRTRNKGINAISDDCEEGQVVGPYSWPLLSWLIDLYTNDELSRQGTDKYSILLLSQLPLPKAGNKGRWDAEAPLDVIFYCFDQDNRWRRELGERLLGLLVNLTLSDDFDATMFIDTLLTRLHTQDSMTFDSFISCIPSTSAGYLFRIALCKQYLSWTENAARPEATLRPQARAQPRRATGTRGTAASTPTETAPTPGTMAGRLAMAPTREIIRVLQLPLPEADKNRTLRMKFELVAAKMMLQLHTDEEDRDQDWDTIIRSGALCRIVDQEFVIVEEDGTKSDARTWKDELNALITA